MCEHRSQAIDTNVGVGANGELRAGLAGKTSDAVRGGSRLAGARAGEQEEIAWCLDDVLLALRAYPCGEESGRVSANC